MALSDLEIKFRKAMSEWKRESKIQECFHPEKSECKLPIKLAHSLQRNGRLSLIEDDVNGQNVLYTSTSVKTGKERMIMDFIPVGKAAASTFNGFCDKHDSEIFSPIENFEFDGSDKHLFLHSYRSFAHSFHRKKEELKMYKSDWEVYKELPKFMLDGFIEMSALAVSEMEPQKKLLDQMLLNEKFNELEYSLLETDDFHPFGCSSIVNPHFTVKNERMDDLTDTTKPIINLMLTVVPDKTNSFAIVAGFPDSKETITFINHLEELDDLKYKHAISSMMTNLAENTFWSPKLWDFLGKSGQQPLINDASFVAEVKKWDSFRWSSLNLYSSRYTASNLGIVK